jgi:glycosyltransferase involved in cell wall biosynthesis
MMKVSIVVAVYNPGRYLDLPVESFLRQTMARDEFEVVFVDDGSTDGSGRRLDRLARKHANFRAIHIPNSGWPGRPRNLGIDASTGRYVLFVDHDDWLEDDALAYLWDVAETNGADVVAAREIGHGFGVPRRMFRRTITDAKLGRDDLLALLTPHKLFRRSVLVEHGVRFPEGPRRLEDHHFVVAAYFAARRITVTGDHPIYHWAKRDAGENATGQPFDPASYYDNLRDILDIVDANTEPGELRDRLYAHWLRYKLVHKLLRPHFREPGPRSRAVFGEVRRLMEERFGIAVDRYLPVGYRLVARAARADRLDLVAAAARLANGLSLEVALLDAHLDGDRIRLDLDHVVRGPDGTELQLHRHDEGLTWQPPPEMTDGLDLSAEDLDCTDQMPASELSLVLRLRGADLEFDRPQPIPTRESDDGTVQVAGRTTVEVDPETFAAGSRLPDGTWDAIVQAEFGGFRAHRRLPAESLRLETEGRTLRAYVTERGQLAMTMGTSSAGGRYARRVIRAPAPSPVSPRALARRALPVTVRRLAREWIERFRA